MNVRRFLLWELLATIKKPAQRLVFLIVYSLENKVGIHKFRIVLRHH